MQVTISDVVKQKLCSSCGACFSVCNKNSISFEETVGGYLHPVIDTSKCTMCGLCHHVCPGIHLGSDSRSQLTENPFIGKIKASYIGKSTDQEFYLNSQSGGMVTAMLYHLLKTKQIEAAIVAIMGHTIPPRGEVILATNREDLLNAQKSKYTPIPVLKILKEITSLSGKIAIVGLPCQIHGLNNILETLPTIRSKIVIKIGLICERILTNTAIDLLTHIAKEKQPNHIIFKDKNRPHYPGNIVVRSNTGEEKVLDSVNRMLIKNYFTPARCTICWDKLNIFSDIVFGDPHGIQNIDRQLGEGLILVRTNVGENYLKSASYNQEILIREIDYEKAILGQRIPQKMHSWDISCNSWIKQNRVIPEYFSLISTGVNSNNNNYNSVDIRIQRNSILLDKFQSKHLILNFYCKKLLIDKIAEKVRYKLKKILRYFIGGLF